MQPAAAVNTLLTDAEFAHRVAERDNEALRAAPEPARPREWI